MTNGFWDLPIHWFNCMKVIESEPAPQIPAGVVLSRHHCQSTLMQAASRSRRTKRPASGN